MNIAGEYADRMEKLIKVMHNQTLKKWNHNLQNQYKRAAGITDSPSDEIEKIIEQLKDEYQIKDEFARQMTRDMLKRVRTFGIEQVDNQINAIAGVNPNLRYPRMAEQLKIATQENVRLIKTIPEKYLGEVERVIHEGVLQGTPTNKLTEQIEMASKKTTNNAKLIARDQVGKFLAVTTKARQTQAGVKHYIWRTVGDNRVRPSHEDFEGNKYSWEEGSPEGHPGEPIQCRCIAEPDRDEILNNYGPE
jgi:SPP1 gp7 family putative phage head morphogenesis protein